jgi:Flp pilus assembly protein TadG
MGKTERMKTRPFIGNEGASAVEFAVILPLLVLVLFGIIEFSLALYDKAMITNASREGARAGIVYRIPAVPDAEIATVVNTYLRNHLITFGGAPSAMVSVARNGNSPGGELKVRVAYTYVFLVLPGLSSGRGRGINMAAETVMRLE